MGMTTDADVIVVGAGLAGLTAATTARRAGSRVIVLEAHTPGGRARTLVREGFTFNLGAHALTRRGAGMAVLAELGVVPTGSPPPLHHYRALAGGHLHALPTGPSSLLRTGALGARSKAQLARLLGRLPRLRSHELHRTTVAGWLAGQHLRPDAESVVRALIRLSTYTVDVDEFSADAALSQLQTNSAGGVLYLHGGWSVLVDRLAHGLDVRTGVEVTGIDHRSGHLEVRSRAGTLVGDRVVVANGGPSAVRRLLPVDPGWGVLGPPVTAACLDLGVTRVPDPGYVLSLDEPVYATVQSPPARQAPAGGAVVAALRYGTRGAATDRAELESLVATAGVGAGDVVTRRFLASMTVTGVMPTAATGGLAGRPGTEDSGVPGLTIAGDWVGPVGLLADAALASGRAAGSRAGQEGPGSARVVA